MKSTTSYILLLFVFLYCAKAQDQKEERLDESQSEINEKEQKKDSVSNKNKIDYRPTEMRVGADIVSFGNTIFEDNLERVELNADIDFHHYLLNIDLGYENDSFDSIKNISNAIYSITGQYFKIGIDRSFSVDNPTNSDIFMGFRYARAFYQDELKYLVSDDIWETGNVVTESNRASVGWIELTFGMKVNLTKYLSIGYTWRLKTKPSVKGNDAFEPFKIPGHGTTLRNNNISLNFFAMFRLPATKLWSKGKSNDTDLPELDNSINESP